MNDLVKLINVCCILVDQVTTEDGYILSLQRIPEGRAQVSGGGKKQRQPVILQHGVLVVS